MADASFLTPEATVRSYQAYLASDLVDWEYRCYSRDFKRRNGISRFATVDECARGHQCRFHVVLDGRRGCSGGET